MSLYHAPRAVTNGLLLNLDFTNAQNYTPLSQQPLQNLLQQSENIHLSPWLSTNSATRTQTAIVGPLGTGLTTRVVSSATAPTLIYQEVSTTITGTGPMRCSVYAKADTSTSFTFNCYYGLDTEVNVTFNLSNGTTNTPASSKIESVGNGWYRCTIFVPARVNASTLFAYRIWPEARSTATSKGCLFWGAQLTTLDASETYTQSTTSAVTFNSQSSGTVITDHISKTSFTISNPSYYSISDGSIQFNRDSSFKMGSFMNATATGSLTAANFLYNNHTWEILFRVNDRTPGQYDATEFDSVVAAYRGYHAGYMYASNQLRYYMWSGTTAYQVGTWTLGTSGTEIVQGQWCHIAITKNGSIWTEYLNGNKTITTTQAVSSAGIGVTNDLRFGSGNGGATLSYSYFSKCNLALSRMYNRALSDSEIKQNFNSIRGRYGL
jgi:hypothetical protein